MELSNNNAKTLLLDTHQDIEEYAESLVANPWLPHKSLRVSSKDSEVLVLSSIFEQNNNLRRRSGFNSY